MECTIKIQEGKGQTRRGEKIISIQSTFRMLRKAGVLYIVNQ